MCFITKYEEKIITISKVLLLNSYYTFQFTQKQIIFESSASILSIHLSDNKTNGTAGVYKLQTNASCVHLPQDKGSILIGSCVKKRTSR